MKKIDYWLIGAIGFIAILAIWAIYNNKNNIIKGVMQPIINRNNPENFTHK